MTTPAHDLATQNIILIIAKVVSEAVAAEREACAKIALFYYMTTDSTSIRSNYELFIGQNIATAIRAREGQG